MQSRDNPPRRTFLKYSAGIAGITGLAGCVGGDDDTTNGTDGTTNGTDDTLQVAAMMPSPTDDLGYSQANSESIQNATESMDGVELTNIVDSVALEDADDVSRNLAQDNDLIIADSNGWLQGGTMEVAEDEQDTYFMTRNAALPPEGLPENQMTYNQHFGSVWGPMGYIASRLPGVNTVGCADSVPVLVRFHALRGAKCALEDGDELIFNWINAWFGPEDVRRNAQELIEQGADALLNGTNSTVPGEIAEENDMFSVGYGTDMSVAAEDGYATSVLLQPEPIFEEGMQAARDGNWDDYWNRYDNHHPWAPKDYQGENTIALTDFHDDVPEDVQESAEQFVNMVDNYEVEYPEVWEENVCPDGTEFEIDFPS